MVYLVINDIEQPDYTEVSLHRTLAGAGRSYQAARTGNMRRVIDANGRDVTGAALDAVNAGR